MHRDECDVVIGELHALGLLPTEGRRLPVIDPYGAEVSEPRPMRRVDFDDELPIVQAVPWTIPGIVAGALLWPAHRFLGGVLGAIVGFPLGLGIYFGARILLNRRRSVRVDVARALPPRTPRMLPPMKEENS